MRQKFENTYERSIELTNNKVNAIEASLKKELAKGQEQGLSQVVVMQKYCAEHPTEPQLFGTLEESIKGTKVVAELFDEFIAAYIILWDKYYWAVKNAIDTAKKEMN
jgi:hypothetical protein